RVLSIEFITTRAEIAGAKIRHKIEGKSFLPLLRGQTIDDKDRPLFFERREGGDQFGGLAIHAVNVNGWKLLQNRPNEKQQLYNLNEDPFEQTDLIDTHPDKFKELNALLRQHIQWGGRIPWQDRKSTRLNSSHVKTSYAVFCLKKKRSEEH